jgi:hypothetical protein
MRKIIVAALAAIPLVAGGAYALAQPATTTAGDDLFALAPKPGQVTAEKGESGQSVAGKRLTIGDFSMESENGEHGEAGEGMEGGE